MSWVTAFFSWLMGLFTGKEPEDPRVKIIQEMVVSACFFLPMADSIMALLALPINATAPAAAVATSICAAIKKHGLSQTVLLADMGRSAQTQWVIVQGIKIEGIKTK